MNVLPTTIVNVSDGGRLSHHTPHKISLFEPPCTTPDQPVSCLTLFGPILAKSFQAPRFVWIECRQKEINESDPPRLTAGATPETAANRRSVTWLRPLSLNISVTKAPVSFFHRCVSPSIHLFVHPSVRPSVHRFIRSFMHQFMLQRCCVRMRKRSEVLYTSTLCTRWLLSWDCRLGPSVRSFVRHRTEEEAFRMTTATRWIEECVNCIAVQRSHATLRRHFLSSLFNVTIRVSISVLMGDLFSHLYVSFNLLALL